MSKQNLSPIRRLIYFFVGAGIATFLLLFSFRWEDLGIGFDFIGVNINIVIYAFATVMVGIFAGSLLKSSILGMEKLD